MSNRLDRSCLLMFPPLKKLSFGFALSMEMGSCQRKNITHSPTDYPRIQNESYRKTCLRRGTGGAAQLLVEACGPSFTTKRPRGKIFPNSITPWTDHTSERNAKDLQYLFEGWGSIPVGLTGKDLINEATFTLNCMVGGRRDIEMEKLGTTGSYWGENFENQMINFGHPPRQYSK